MTRQTVNKLIPWFFVLLFCLALIKHIQYDHKIINNCFYIPDDEIEILENELLGMAFDRLDDLLDFTDRENKNVDNSNLDRLYRSRN